MTDREKVIKGLECCKDIHTAGPGYAQGCTLCPYGETPSDGAGGYACFRAMVKDALVLLKAQEPVEPNLLAMNSRLSNGTKCICGGCGGSFLHQKVNFCPWCGKAVKWE